MTETRKPSLSVREMLATVHLWLGVVFSLPFIAIGLSGSVLMLGHDIPGFGDAHAPPAITRPVDDVISAARALAPEGSTLNMIAAPEHQGEPISVRFNAAGGGRGAQINVDQATLAAERVAAPRRDGAFNVMRLMHDLHGRLLIDGGVGRQIVGWLGVFMCVLGVSGLVMWWPRGKQWKNAFTFKFCKSALKSNRDMHSAVGIWSLVVFMIVSISGVYLGFPQQIATFFDAHPMVRDQRGNRIAPVQPIEGAASISAGAAVTLAQAAVPDGSLWSVIFPPRPETPLRVNLTRVVDGKAARVAVYIDPWQAKIVEVRDPTALSGLDRLLFAQRGLHVGTQHGPIWWALVFLSGFLPVLFTITGVTMWLLKRRNKRRVMQQA